MSEPGPTYFVSDVVPPLNPDQETPERVLALAGAALTAAADIEIVLHLWPFPGYSLKNLRRLAQELN
jgi:hypothetical protein